MKSALFFLATLLALFPLAVLSSTSIDTRGVRRRTPIIDTRTRPPPTLSRRAPPKASKLKSKATPAKQKSGKETTAAKKTQKGTTTTKKKAPKGTTAAKGKTGATCAWTPGAKGRIREHADCESAGGGADSGIGTWSLLCTPKVGGSSSTAGGIWEAPHLQDAGKGELPHLWWGAKDRKAGTAGAAGAATAKTPDRIGRRVKWVCYPLYLIDNG
ncbi:hypothetical protein DFP73DRAFT_528114 [Morchella snyderi]|nr:hypothetical protein DFP73DRAFT_528114 [Morchella snyderi]